MRLFRAFAALRRFSKDQNGSMMIVFAAVFAALVFATGMAMDLSRMVIARQILQQNLDSAILAASIEVKNQGYALADPQAPVDVLERIEDHFSDAMEVSAVGATGMIYSSFYDYIDLADGWQVRMNAEGQIEPGLTRIFGVKTLYFRVKSEVFLPENSAEWARVVG